MLPMKLFLKKLFDFQCEKFIRLEKNDRMRKPIGKFGCLTKKVEIDSIIKKYFLKIEIRCGHEGIFTGHFNSNCIAMLFSA